MFGKSKAEKDVITPSMVSLWTMRDMITGLCGPIFEAYNAKDAVRFAQRLRIAAYKDFELVCVGKFDRSSGKGEMFKEGYVHEWITLEYEAEVNHYLEEQRELFARLPSFENGAGLRREG